jgi:thiamine-phosphate pyrophosphorylase
VVKESVFRILDANFNRIGEGLRVIEEIFRFVLLDKKLSLKTKNLRGEFVKLKKEIFKKPSFTFRDVKRDFGRKFFSETEGKRENLSDIFSGNIKRIQEGSRVLEEFLKLFNKKLSKKAKKIRFVLYSLEQEAAPKIKKNEKLSFDLYLVTDPMADHFKAVKKASLGGIKVVQLRDKIISKNAYKKVASKIIRYLKGRGVVFVINDYYDLVKVLNADGVHLGQEDIKKVSIKDIRKIVGNDKIIGISTHSIKQAQTAQERGADYISFGPIFSTKSKPLYKPLGLANLAKVKKRISIPIVAIGGINLQNLSKINALGIKRVAMIRGIVEAKDISRRVRKILNELRS